MRRIALIFVGGVLFLGYCIAVVPKNTPEIHWYQYPIVLPLIAGIAVGGNAHNISGIALYLALGLECFLAGIMFERLVVITRRFAGKDRT